MQRRAYTEIGGTADTAKPHPINEQTARHIFYAGSPRYALHPYVIVRCEPVVSYMAGRDAVYLYDYYHRPCYRLPLK